MPEGAQSVELRRVLNEKFNEREREVLDMAKKEAWDRGGIKDMRQLDVLGVVDYLKSQKASPLIRAMVLHYLLTGASTEPLEFNVLEKAKNGADNADEG